MNINEEIIKKSGLEIQEVLLLLTINLGFNPTNLLLSLIDKNYIFRDLESGRYIIKKQYKDLLQDILLNSEDNIPKADTLDDLVLKMMKIFPSGLKEGTSSSFWRGNKREVKRNLQKFFLKYGNYSEEEILNATKKYVDYFNGQYDYMRILKYFILKEVPKKDEEGRTYIEETSDLATQIENEELGIQVNWNQLV